MLLGTSEFAGLLVRPWWPTHQLLGKKEDYALNKRGSQQQVDSFTQLFVCKEHFLALLEKSLGPHSPIEFSPPSHRHGRVAHLALCRGLEGQVGAHAKINARAETMLLLTKRKLHRNLVVSTTWITGGYFRPRDVGQGSRGMQKGRSKHDTSKLNIETTKQRRRKLRKQTQRQPHTTRARAKERDRGRERERETERERERERVREPERERG